MRCFTCNNFAPSLFRVNSKGEKGIFKCVKCMTPTEINNLDTDFKKFVESLIKE